MQTGLHRLRLEAVRRMTHPSNVSASEAHALSPNALS
jgi:hypothetical protein